MRNRADACRHLTSSWINGRCLVGNVRETYVEAIPKVFQCKVCEDEVFFDNVIDYCSHAVKHISRTPKGGPIQLRYLQPSLAQRQALSSSNVRASSVPCVGRFARAALFPPLKITADVPRSRRRTVSVPVLPRRGGDGGAGLVAGRSKPPEIYPAVWAAWQRICGRRSAVASQD